MTTTNPLFSQYPSFVKSALSEGLVGTIDEIMKAAEAGASLRELERMVVDATQQLGRDLLGSALGMQTRQATQADIEKRGVDRTQISVRTDVDYWYTLTTTLGRVTFPVFAYRVRRSLSTSTINPSQKLFPLHKHCRSSPQCLEWEVRLGSTHPFRTAQQELRFFTHGAVTLEDNTIARHTSAVGAIVDWRWTYRTVQEIRKVLRTRATRDTQTGKPIIYASCDACALRRYVDDTYSAPWKMTNGLRLWCVDAETNEIVHLGGEYTWGNCERVKLIVSRLIASGHLPADGNYGEDEDGESVVAQVTWVTDGMPWFEEHILKLFPDARVILDAFHVLDKIASFAAEAWGRGNRMARQLNRQAYAAALGAPRLRRDKAKKRKGHRKHRRAETVARRREEETTRARLATTNAQPLLTLLRSIKVPYRCAEALAALVRYITNNAYRIDYARYIKEGYQIGSGAMESLHRVGCQLRMKRSGPGWLEETSKAVFDLRMMTLAGRWEEFWSQPDLETQLVNAFQAA